MIRLLALLVALAGPAGATQEYQLPTLFDVTGVAADDVLNVRAAPDSGAEIVGALPPDAEGVEVVAHDATGRWGLVNTARRSGWVAMRFLAYRTDVWEEGALPEELRCVGTEPFWSLRQQGERLVLARPEAEVTGRLVSVLGTGVFRDPRRAVVAEGEAWRLTALLAPRRCSDGMSDFAYGLEASVVREGETGAELLVGCCRIGR